MDALSEGGAECGGDDVRDLLLLDALPGVGPATVRALCRRFGGARAALEAPARLFRAAAGPEAAAARARPETFRRVDAALERARCSGLSWVTWSDDQYPDAFRPLADPPPVVFLLGRGELLGASPALTVVGSRRVTVRGREVARTLGSALARAGICTVSGLALGTDAAAHAGALDAGGDTIAVLGTGADVPYPRTHARLYRAVAERGLVVSEFLPGTRAAPHHFPRRNRLLAALGGLGTVVVEAGARSGALITVDHALDLGRDVWAVPGPIDGPACAGSNALLADGAYPLLSVQTFAASVAPTSTRADEIEVGGGRAEEGTASGVRGASGVPVRGGAGREEEGGEGGPVPDVPSGSPEAGVLRALREGPADPGELGRRCGLPVAVVLGTLSGLELEGRVIRLPGLRFRAAA